MKLLVSQAWKACVALCAAATLHAAEPVRVLLVTGGHDYETNQFLAMFGELGSVRGVQHVTHPQAHGWFSREKAAEYDVIVFYDMWQEIGNEAKENLVARLKEGKGLVAMHHCLASYQAWGEYAQIIGGKYHLEKREENGVEKPSSTYRHDVKFKVRVANRAHPVTEGLDDFEIHDETYGGFEVKPGVDVLLTTEEATSGPNLVWAKRYGEARVVYIQLGHDHLAWENPSFRRLVGQAIAWTGRK